MLSLCHTNITHSSLDVDHQGEPEAKNLQKSCYETSLGQSIAQYKTQHVLFPLGPLIFILFGLLSFCLFTGASVFLVHLSLFVCWLWVTQVFSVVVR